MSAAGLDHLLGERERRLDLALEVGAALRVGDVLVVLGVHLHPRHAHHPGHADLRHVLAHVGRRQRLHAEDDLERELGAPGVLTLLLQQADVVLAVFDGVRVAEPAVAERAARRNAAFEWPPHQIGTCCVGAGSICNGPKS